jgi:hypothetical protein
MESNRQANRVFSVKRTLRITRSGSPSPDFASFQREATNRRHHSGSMRRYRIKTELVTTGFENSDQSTKLYDCYENTNKGAIVGGEIGEYQRDKKTKLNKIQTELKKVLDNFLAEEKEIKIGNKQAGKTGFFQKMARDNKIQKTQEQGRYS